MFRFVVATFSTLSVIAANIMVASASSLKTQCTLEIASGDKFLFPCSLSYDPRLNMGVIKNLNSGKTYGRGWAEGRGCLYKEGYGSICTKEFKWILPNGQIL